VSSGRVSKEGIECVIVIGRWGFVRGFACGDARFRVIATATCCALVLRIWEFTGTIFDMRYEICIMCDTIELPRPYSIVVLVTSKGLLDARYIQRSREALAKIRLVVEE
jgi:hypothetical protein